MPVISEKDVFNQYLKKSEAEAIAFLESDMMIKKQKLHDAYVTQASQIERDKEVSTQENQARRDHAIQKIQQSLSSSSTKTWSDYQAAEATSTVDEKAAELLYAQTFFSIHHDYSQKKNENDAMYKNESTKLERLFDDRLRQVSHRYAPVYRLRNAKINEVREPYQHAVNKASTFLYRSKRETHDLTKKISDQVHAEAFKERNAAGERHQIGAEELLKTSYEMVAKRLGLDGVTPDITGNVGANTPYPYDSIQPIVGYMDLKWALYEATKNSDESELIRRFYDVSSDDPAVDVARLNKAVKSLDLGALSLVFKHRCLFMAPPLIPDERTLYVDFCGEDEDKVNLTVISPYGDILRRSYHITTELSEQIPDLDTSKRVLTDEIVANTTEFVQKLYYRDKAGSFDAFSALMASTPGFKAHVIKTIAASNRALKRPEGVDDIKLTKRHISSSKDGTICTFDETPSHDAREVYHALTHSIDARYYARCKVLEETCAEAIHEAELLKQDMCRRAQAVYDSSCDEIEHELAWDELAAEISVHAKAFDYFTNQGDQPVSVEQPAAEADTVSADASAAYAMKPMKSLEGFKSKKTFGKSQNKPHRLFSIAEHEYGDESMDDDDREVYEIMQGR
mgnify:CR=1 FL=1|tara:strand:+ start:91571 stop:93445 length:1875 start_codon:yes stop_codon:yes gene_type:complete